MVFRFWRKNSPTTQDIVEKELCKLGIEALLVNAEILHRQENY
jgi:hypothetical protein